MITEDFVSFKIAKLLKEKDFKEKCNATYNLETGEFKTEKTYQIWTTKLGKYISAPTLQMAMKWLREKYNYQIIVTPEYGDVEYMPGQWQEEFLGWKYTIIPFNGNKSIMHPSVYSITTESAYESAIKYCLENLI